MDLTDVIRTRKKCIIRVTPRQHKFPLGREALHHLQSQRPVKEICPIGCEKFVQHQKVGLPCLHSCPCITQEGIVASRDLCLVRLAHPEGKAIVPVAALHCNVRDQRKAHKLRGLRAFEKLHDADTHSAACRTYSKSQGGSGLALAVAAIDLDQSFAPGFFVIIRMPIASMIVPAPIAALVPTISSTRRCASRLDRSR